MNPLKESLQKFHCTFQRSLPDDDASRRIGEVFVGSWPYFCLAFATVLFSSALCRIVKGQFFVAD